MLPELVDGKNIFLRAGEVIRQARLLYDPDVEYYVSNLYRKEKGNETLVCGFVLARDGSRLTTWIPENELEYLNEAS